MTDVTKLFRLDGCIAVITGAGSGMGRAMAVLFASAGCRGLVVAGRRAPALTETAELVRKTAPQCNVITVPTDVANAYDRSTLVAKAGQEFGVVDVLVNNAGIFAGSSLEDTSDEDWRRVFAVNSEAPFALARLCLPLLSKSKAPSIINVSSTLAEKPIPNATAYNASKAAVVQTTRSLALELGPRRIRVNAILPAIVDTPMYRGRYQNDAEYQKSLPDVGKLHPLGRVGSPDDIANAALFLASPASSWITGVALPVDGGMLVT